MTAAGDEPPPCRGRGDALEYRPCRAQAIDSAISPGSRTSRVTSPPGGTSTVSRQAVSPDPRSTNGVWRPAGTEGKTCSVPRPEAG